MARCSDMLLEILGIQKLNYIAHKISMGKNADYFYITAFCYFKFLLLFSFSLIDLHNHTICKMT